MNTTKQKQIRMSEEGRFLLHTCKEGTGYSDTKIMELCLALHALVLRREVRRAHEFLHHNLLQYVAAEAQTPSITLMRHGQSHAAKGHRAHPQPGLKHVLNKKRARKTVETSIPKPELKTVGA